MSKANKILRNVQPKMLTFAELYSRLWPYICDWKWAKESLWDLWIMGAPVPQDRCPGNRPCKQYPRCKHIRRIILPEQFAAWWNEVAKRRAEEIRAKYESL